MAQLRAGIPKGFEQIEGEGWEAQHARHEAAFNALAAAAEALPEGTLKGQMLRFPVADGYAHYLIVKDSPLVLQLIPMGDSYTADPALIRGLRRIDALEQIKHYASFKRLFAKRA
jgi:hypothetical protein